MAAPESLTLWPKGVPDGWTRPDKEVSEKGDFLILKQVSQPTLEFFRSPKAKPNAPTVLVVPGGGYFVVAIEHEGTEIARWLNEAGYHAAVLKYRIPVPDRDKVRHLPPLQDLQRALRVLRAESGRLGLDPKKLGVMGFSAGGHLSATVCSAREPSYARQDAADDQSAVPNFLMLIYGAYLNQENTLDLAPEVAVKPDSPPTFLVHTQDDWVPYAGPLAFARACGAAKVPVELHLFPKGGHGYGIRTKEPGIREWPGLAAAWLGRL